MRPAPEPALRAPSSRRSSSRPWRRWLAIVTVSVLVHLATFDLLPRWTPDRDPAPSGDEPLRATLMPAIQASPPPAPAPVPAPRTERPSPAPAARPRRPPEFVPESTEPVQQVGLDAPTPAVPGDTAAGDATAGAVAPPAAEPPSEAPSASPPAPAPAPPPPPPATPPRSARLDYKVLYTDAKNATPTHYYGVGSIEWTLDGDAYRSELVAAVDFLLFKVNVLASHSDGRLVAGGLAPDRYTETPRKRPTVATNFNRDARQNVSFSAAATTAPLLPGTQDRLSVLFQIGALLLASGDATTTDPIDIPVAGVRGDVETWRFERRGDETITAAGASLVATHLRRAARPDSNDRTIDVWVAARDGGYPARVLYTEPNGSTIEMTLDRIDGARR